jgi:hypothetical protein
VVANIQLARLLAELHHGFARPWKRTFSGQTVKSNVGESFSLSIWQSWPA